MKRIRTLAKVNVPSGSYPAGAVIEVEDHHADYLVARNAAEHHHDRPQKIESETADMPIVDVETATLTKPKRKASK